MKKTQEKGICNYHHTSLLRDADISLAICNVARNRTLPSSKLEGEHTSQHLICFGFTFLVK